MPSTFTWLDYPEHERRKMLDVVEAHKGRIELFYLPRRAPELNPPAAATSGSLTREDLTALPALTQRVGGIERLEEILATLNGLR